jgi:hypothetical protein
MANRKSTPRVAGKPQPATTDKTQGSGKAAVKDRKASPGNRYSDEQAPTAEGNDPSHAAGRTLVRKTPGHK